MSDLFGEDRTHSTGTGQLDDWMNGGYQLWKESVGPDLLGGYATLVLKAGQQNDDDHDDQDDDQQLHASPLPIEQEEKP